MESEEAAGLAVISSIIMSGLVKSGEPLDVIRRRAINQAQLLLEECEDAIRERPQQ